MQIHLIPNRWHLDFEMRIVSENGLAGCGQRTGDDPGVGTNSIAGWTQRGVEKRSVMLKRAKESHREFEIVLDLEVADDAGVPFPILLTITG